MKNKDFYLHSNMSLLIWLTECPANLDKYEFTFQYVSINMGTKKL